MTPKFLGNYQEITGKSPIKFGVISREMIGHSNAFDIREYHREITGQYIHNSYSLPTKLLRYISFKFPWNVTPGPSYISNVNFTNKKLYDTHASIHKLTQAK